VADRDGQAEPLREPLAQRHVVPAEVDGVARHAVGVVDEAGDHGTHRGHGRRP
jgi:hypothetical protein